jgi:[ribosomal protein S5]-alanine N-acetyltransferase
VIETPRLLLRPMQEDDVEALLGVFGDPKVMAAFGSEPFKREQMERWVHRNLEHQERYGYGLFSVILRDSGLLIGDCGFEWMELDGESRVELGYDVRSDHWGQGLATEAAGAVRDYAFGTLELLELVSVIRQRNDASRRVAEKIGMRRLDDIERYGHGYWLYAIARDDALKWFG